MIVRVEPTSTLLSAISEEGDAIAQMSSYVSLFTSFRELLPIVGRCCSTCAFVRTVGNVIMDVSEV